MSDAPLPTATEIADCRPWPRHILPQATWQALVAAPPDSGPMLLALWADTLQVHALFLDPEALTATVASTPVEDGRYPAVSGHRPAAALFERMIADLWGHAADGGAALRPWLDHGHWPQSHPMAARPVPARLPDDDEGLLEPDTPLMQLDLGPIHGRLDEAARLRLQVRDGTIAAAETRLGFTHKGTLTLMRGKSPRTAARFAARLSGNATVAHALAFARAAEAALGVEIPPRAAALRLAMLEIERVAVHLDTLAETARLAEAPAAWTTCGALREHLLRATGHAFGHRLMMDCVVPGGVAVDIAEASLGPLLHAVAEAAASLPALRRHAGAPALCARLGGLGHAGPALLRACGAGGPVARAAGLGFDARRLDGDAAFLDRGTKDGPAPGLLSPDEPPGDADRPAETAGPDEPNHDERAARPVAADPAAMPARPPIATLPRGDALARHRLRIAEIAASLATIDRVLRTLPAPPLTVALPQESGEGIGCAESARGDVWHWLRLDHGQIAACFPRDPGWALWPAAEAVMRHAAVEDIALIAASFALPASGMDL